MADTLPPSLPPVLGRDGTTPQAGRNPVVPVAPLTDVPNLPPSPKTVSTPSLSIASASSINKTARKAADRQVTVSALDSLLPIVYGNPRVPALMANALYGSGNWYFWVIWALGPIQSIDSISLNDAVMPTGVSITNYLGNAGQGVDTTLRGLFAAQPGLPTYAETLPGICYSVIWSTAKILSTGPQFNAILKGRKIYDPRQDSTNGGTGSQRLSDPTTWTWSRNPTLCLADFLTSTAYGDSKTLDWSTVITCANANDNVVGTSPNTETQRYFDGLVDTSQTTAAWVETLRTAACCFVVPEGDIVKLIPDIAASSVASYSHSAGNIIEITNDAVRETDSLPTVIEVVYTNTSVLPWADCSVYANRPGVNGITGGTTPWRKSTINMPWLIRPTQANREAAERLNKLWLRALAMDVHLMDEWMLHEPGDVITLTYPDGGYSALPVRVVKITPNADGTGVLSVEKEDPNAYSTLVQDGQGTGLTNLPSPTLPPATTVSALSEVLFRTADGLYSSKISVTLTNPDFPFVQSYVIETYAGSIAPANLVDRGVVTSPAYITPPLKEQVAYTVQAWIISTSQTAGAAGTAAITLLGKVTPPSDVTGFQAFAAAGRIFASWAASVDTTLDTIRYEVRIGAAGATWNSATLLDRVSALSYGTQGLAAGTYQLLVKSLDSVGNYAVNAASATVVVTVDTSAYNAYNYTNGTNQAVAMSLWMDRKGTRWAVTDFGDGIEYGEATQLNTVGDMLGQASTVLPQPHRSALMYAGDGGLVNGRYVSVPYNAAYNVGTTFTHEAWVYLVAYAPSTGSGIVSRKINQPAGSYDFRVTTGGNLQVQGVGTVCAQSNEVIPLFTWTKVATTINGTTTRLYINDKECTYSTSNTYTYANNTDAMWIGAIRNGAILSLQGIISRSKFWNKVLTVAQMQLSSQYANDPTGIGGLIGAWTGNDSTQGSTATVYADVSTTANNGAVTSGGTGYSSPDWRSYSRCVTTPIDLGQSVNGTFSVGSGSFTALNGTVVPVIRLSTDGITYTEYQQSAVTSSARFFSYGYEAQGGSMVVNLTALAASVLIVPKVETPIVANLATGIQSAILSNLYAQIVDLQGTPLGVGGATPLVCIPDQTEVAPLGIAGGLQVARLGNPSNVGYFTRSSLVTSSTITFEALLRTDSNTTQDVVFNLPNDANTSYFILAFDIGTTASVYMLGSATGSFTFSLAGKPCPRPANNTWVRLSIVFNGTAVSLYYNGILVGTGTSSSPVSTSTARTMVLGASVSGGNGFTGRMYDVRLWNSALSQATISANAFVQVDPTSAGLLAYWKLNGDATDATANANTLTPNGTVVYRPLNGFDSYLFNSSFARVAGSVRWRWTGA